MTALLQTKPPHGARPAPRGPDDPLTRTPMAPVEVEIIALIPRISVSGEISIAMLHRAGRMPRLAIGLRVEGKIAQTVTFTSDRDLDDLQRGIDSMRAALAEARAARGTP